MPGNLFKLLCSLVFITQLLALSGLARGMFVCVHADGTAQVETVGGLADCHAEQELAEDSSNEIDSQACIDSPVLAEAATQSRAAQVGSINLGSHTPPAIVPAILTQLVDLFAKPRATHLSLHAPALRDVERDALVSVILVI